MTPEETMVANAVAGWNSNVARADKFFSALSEKQLEATVAPGRNRLIYLWGHLAAVSDAMIPLLGIGERLHTELDVPFLKSADGAGATMPNAAAVKKAWDEINVALGKGVASYSAADWLLKHSAVSDEDFAKEPLRNRFAILLGRTVHLSYHIGQTSLAPLE